MKMFGMEIGGNTPEEGKDTWEYLKESKDNEIDDCYAIIKDPGNLNGLKFLSVMISKDYELVTQANESFIFKKV